MKSSLSLQKCVDAACSDYRVFDSRNKSPVVETIVSAGAKGLQAVLKGPTKAIGNVDFRDVWDALQTLIWRIAQRHPQVILEYARRHPKTRWRLISSLAVVRGKEATQILIDAMSDTSSFGREQAADALIARKSAEAKPVLFKALLDRSPDVRSRIVAAINKVDVFRDPAALPNLRRLLDYKQTKMSPGTLESVQQAITRLERESQGLPVLEGHYSWSSITNRDLAKLVKDHPQLRLLDLSETRIGDAGIAHLCALKHLEALDLNNASVTAKGVAMLAKSALRLRSLHLGGPRLGPGTLDALSTMWSLEQLDIMGVTTRDKTLSQLVPLKNLKSLSLGWRLTDDGVSSVLYLRKLERLDLYSTLITDAGLLRLKSLKRLKWLRLCHANGVTDDAIAKLQKQLPKCEVLR